MNTSSWIRFPAGVLRIDREVIDWKLTATPASYWWNDESVSVEQVQEILGAASGLPNLRFLHG